MKQDIKAVCAESGCGKEFVITAEEQEHCERNEYPLPKRCKPCRLVKRARFEAKERAMSLEEVRQNSPFKEVFDKVCGGKRA